MATDGGRGRDGTWHPVPEWDSLQLMRLFRECLLARLVERRAISKELVGKRLAWRHSGFSAHVGQAIAPEDRASRTRPPTWCEIQSPSRSSCTSTANRPCSTARR